MKIFGLLYKICLLHEEVSYGKMHVTVNMMLQWNSYLMNPWGMNFHTLYRGYIKLHQETLHLLVRYTVYNYDKIISLHKWLRALFPHTKSTLSTHIHSYIINTIKLVSKIINDIWNEHWKNLSRESKKLWFHKQHDFGACSVCDVNYVVTISGREKTWIVTCFDHNCTKL